MAVGQSVAQQFNEFFGKNLFIFYLIFFYFLSQQSALVCVSVSADNVLLMINNMFLAAGGSLGVCSVVAVVAVLDCIKIVHIFICMHVIS